MIEFWQELVDELEKRCHYLMQEFDTRNARAIQDARTRAEWVALDLRDYGNNSIYTASARRVYASWKSIYEDGIAREHIDEAEQVARERVRKLIK